MKTHLFIQDIEALLTAPELAEMTARMARGAPLTTAAAVLIHAAVEYQELVLVAAPDNPELLRAITTNFHNAVDTWKRALPVQGQDEKP